MTRFFVSLLWLIVVLVIDILAFVLYPPIITFCIPYLRKKGTLTRWWGWLAFLSALGLAGTAFGIG